MPRRSILSAAERESLLELRMYLGMEPFSLVHYRQAVHATTELALQTAGQQRPRFATTSTICSNAGISRRAQAADRALCQKRARCH